MIKLAMEIPVGFLDRWSAKTDLDFVLAHMVLENETYAKFYALRPPGRELILDNSMHELGHPLPPNELQEAAIRVKADFVIPPDRLCHSPADVRRNLDWFDETQSVLGSSFKLAPVLCGLTAVQRINVYNKYTADGAEMLCLPFREARLPWFRELGVASLRDMNLMTRIHLLGMNTVGELSEFARISRNTPQISWSMDTGKAIKLGIIGRRLDDGQPLRGVGVDSAEMLQMRHLTYEQIELIEANIDILRAILA